MRSSGQERRACRGDIAGQDLVLARSAPSERADVLRLRPLLSLSRVELDLLVLVQRPVAGCRDRGEVDEYVRRPVIGGDETKALIGVEPLHCASCHVSEVLIRDATARPRRADREHTRPLAPEPGPCPAVVGRSTAGRWPVTRIGGSLNWLICTRPSGAPTRRSPASNRR